MDMNNNQIRVKGIGRVLRTPDTIVIRMTLRARGGDYSEAVKLGSEQLKCLRQAVTIVGFGKDELKTKCFDIDTEYTDRRKNDGEYERMFKGYAVTHKVELRFPMNLKKLDKLLESIVEWVVNPDLVISFTVDDVDSIKKEILESATKDALEKATILCNAAGKKLGELIRIDYGWDEVRIGSFDDINIECAPGAYEDIASDYDFEPDDIKASDTVEFVWRIE